jgi:hypothetical protein
LAELLDASAAALNQDNQHDGKQNAGNDADKVSAVHGESLSFKYKLEKLQCFAGSGCVRRRSATRAVRSDGARQRSSCRCRERRQAASSVKLVDLGAAALNQNNQHNDKQQTGHDANQSGAIHGETPFFCGLARGASANLLLTFERSAKSRSRCRSGWNCCLAGHVGQMAPPEDPHRLRLVNARAAALNQNSEHNDKQHAGYDSDNRDTVHTDPPFLGSEQL